MADETYLPIGFTLISWSAFNALSTKEEERIYVVSGDNDAPAVYVGPLRCASVDVAFVDSLPGIPDAKSGQLYVDQVSNSIARFDGTKFIELTLIPVSVMPEDGSGTIGNDATVPTTRLVVEYVADQIDQVNQAAANAVTEIAWLTTQKQLQYKTANAASNPVAFALQGLLSNATYDPNTRNLTFETSGGTPITINMPKAEFLQDAQRHVVTQEDLDGPDAEIYAGSSVGDVGILLTMVSGEKFFADLTDFIDIYVAKPVADYDTVITTVSGYEISGQVRISTVAGNTLSAKTDGLYAGAPTFASASGQLIRVGSTGNLEASGVTIGGSTLNVAPTAFVLATEAAVKTYADGKMTKLATTAQGHVVTAGTDGNAVDSGKTPGGATFAATPSSSVLATEIGVMDAISKKLRWEVIE